MSNVFDEIRDAVDSAKDQLEAADATAYDMADLMQGRLRRVMQSNRYGCTDILRTLKRELRDFDATTGQWKK